MSDRLFVGTATNARRGMNTRRFEEFHERLSAKDPNVTQQKLEHRLRKSAAVFSWAYLSRLTDISVLTAKQHVVSSMAQEQFDIHLGTRQKKFFGLGWVAVARASLVETAAIHDLREADVKRSVFFSEDSTTLSRLNRVVVASLEPYGAYDRYAFAAGVANGDINLRPIQPETSVISQDSPPPSEQ